MPNKDDADDARIRQTIRDRPQRLAREDIGYKAFAYDRWSHAALAASRGTGPAACRLAQDSIYVPLFTYRTGPFAGSGIPIADGMHDYLAMLNERDGGIGGVKLVVEECETGYDTKKGVECYEAVKGKNPVVVNPLVDRHHPAADPACRRRQDPDPVHGLRPLGLGASATSSRGCSTRRPPIGTALSMIVKYIGEKEGGLDKLKGKTIGFIHLDAGFGKEPIPLLEKLAKTRLRR